MCLFGAFIGLTDLIADTSLMLFCIVTTLITIVGLVWILRLNRDVALYVDRFLRKNRIATQVVWLSFIFTAVLVILPFYIFTIGAPGGIAALGELGCKDVNAFEMTKPVGNGFFMRVGMGSIPNFTLSDDLPFCQPMISNGYQYPLIYRQALEEYDPDSDDPAAIRTLPPPNPPSVVHNHSLIEKPPIGACEWARRVAGLRGSELRLVLKEVRGQDYFDPTTPFQGILNYFFGFGQKLAQQYGLSMTRDLRWSPYVDPVVGKCGGTSVHIYMPFGLDDIHIPTRCDAIHPSLAAVGGGCATPMPTNLLLRIMLDCARALADVHDLSAARWGVSGTIIHSDIKVSQFRFSAPLHHGGRVFLSDFNRARRRGVAGQCEPIAEGSARSPEELEKRTFTEAADVYSLSWILAGVLHLALFDGGGLPSHALLEGVFPTLPPHTPKGVSDIIHRLWSRNPRERGSARRVANELEALYAEHEPVSWVPADAVSPALT